jgi:hypothetical protein
MRRWGKANSSLVHHIKTMVASKRAELASIRATLPRGEKAKSPSDLLGALVGAQMDVEAEEKVKSGQATAGLSDSEVIGNICKTNA